MTRSNSGVKWLGPVLSVAVACGLFANCGTEERDFETARNRGNGNVDAGADAAADAGDGGQFTANECVGQDDGAECGAMSGFICVNESCRESSCGDGFVDPDTDEECDDGNTDPADGCEPLTCEITCETDADCDDGDPCNGEEACDMGRSMCMTGDAPDTTEQVPCTLPLPPAMDAGTIVDSGASDSGLSDASGPILSDGSVADGSAADGSANGVSDAGESVDPSVGFCKAGLCVPAGCGNGILQAGEDCDDFNLDNTDGCKSDCTYTCVQDTDCDDLSVCTGTESCDTDDHVCIPGERLECEDDVACTHNDCDGVTGCVNSLIDTDGDGHAASDLGACGDDCDDDDATSYTGAGDLCGDDIDNDCNGTPDDAVPFWFLDCDGDGFAQQGAPSSQQCNAPAPLGGCSGVGWTTRIPINGDPATLDCYDSNADAHPGRDPDTFSTSAVPPSKAAPEFDWNCDGVEEKQYPNPTGTGASCNIFVFEPTAGLIFYPLCFSAGGYVSPPECGVAGTFSSCSDIGDGNGCVRRVHDTDPPQPCR